MSRFASPSLADVIIEGMEDRLREVHTSEPGEIVSYDATRQTARVRPVVLRGILDDEGFIVTEEAPDIFDVPVIFPRCGLGFMTFPLRAGDTGLIIYPMRDIGQWRATGQLSDPGDHRVCSMSGAVFLPGIAPDSEIAAASSSDVVIGVLSTALLLLGGPSASDFVALASKVETQLAAIKNAISGAAVSAGDGGAAFKANIMTALNAANVGGSGTTAATKVKAL